MILYLDKNGKAGYYELCKQDYVVSRQAFSNALKKLQEKGMVSRKVIEHRPPRVEYTLTSKGKEIAEVLKQLNKIV